MTKKEKFITISLYSHPNIDVKGSSEVSSKTHTGAQAVAGKVQCMCIAETSLTQPMRLVRSSVVHQILLSLVDAFTCLDIFFKSDLQLKDPMGFK